MTSISKLKDVLKRLDEFDVDYKKQSITEGNSILSLCDYDGVDINIIQE